MPSIWDEMRKDAPSFLKEFGRDVTFRGKTWKVMLENNPLDQMMMDGGMVVKASFKVRFYAEKGGPLEKNPPKFGEQLGIYGRPFTVVSITYHPPSPWYDVVVHSTTQ